MSDLANKICDIILIVSNLIILLSLMKYVMWLNKRVSVLEEESIKLKHMDYMTFMAKKRIDNEGMRPVT